MAPERQRLSRGVLLRAEMVLALGRPPASPRVPPGSSWVPFAPELLEVLSDLELRAFSGGVDARAFSKQLATPAGSRAVWKPVLEARDYFAAASALLICAGTPAGFVLSERRGETGYLVSLGVLPEHRGGVGRALVLFALGAFQRAGLRRAALTVSTENAPAVKLYEKLGFVEHGWSLVTFARGE